MSDNWAVKRVLEIAEELRRKADGLGTHANELVDVAERLGPAKMILYSQRDPRWRDAVYAGNLTFAQAGCYVTCVAMIASLTGSDDTPPVVAGKLCNAGCFSGEFLSRPDRIPQAYPALAWDGALDWRSTAADLGRLQVELARGPMIIEVEFRAGGAAPPLDQHFVLIESFTSDGHDLHIVDPWDGSRTRLLERYALENWDLARAIYGARLLRPRSDSDA